MTKTNVPTPRTRRLGEHHETFRQLLHGDNSYEDKESANPDEIVVREELVG